MQAIIELTGDSPFLDEAVKMVWRQFGDEHNFAYYQDLLMQSCLPETVLPKFYIYLKNDNLVGICALLRYDLVSRQDLSPWLACLYVVPRERVRGIGTALQEHVVREAKRKGFDRVFLCTELEGYYERSNWRCFGRSFLYTGQAVKCYEKQ